MRGEQGDLAEGVVIRLFRMRRGVRSSLSSSVALPSQRASTSENKSSRDEG